MKVDVQNQQVVPIENRPFRSLFTGGRGPLKTTIVVSEAMMWLGSAVNDLVDAKMVSVLNPISKAASLAAPICCFPDAIKFGTDVVRNASRMYEDCSWTTFNDFSHSLVNMAQRVAEFVYGLIRMEIVGDAIQMVFFKGLKSTLQIAHNVYVIHEVSVSESKLDKIEFDSVRKLKSDENAAKFIRAIVNIAYHSVVILAVTLGGVITGKMILAIGIASLVAGVTAHYIECAREDEESKLQAEHINRLIAKAGGWQAA